jgi:hypothetical protein
MNTVQISEDLWRAQRSIATRISRYRRLKKINAPEFLIKKEEELIKQAVERVADHPENMWEDRDLEEEKSLHVFPVLEFSEDTGKRLMDAALERAKKVE